MKFFLTALLALALGCTEVTQLVNPSSVDVSVTPGSTTTGTGNGPSTPAPGTVALFLEPPSPITIQVGKNVSVKVLAKSSGVEVPTQNLQVSIADLTIASVAEIDGRFVLLSGNSEGQTAGIVSANNVQVPILINVVP